MAEVETALDEGSAPDRVDGRRLRRERNIRSVVDAVLEMFAEENLFPTIELAAERSGLSLRSVYRYFPDPEALIQGAIDEIWRRAAPVAHLSHIGEGPFDDRVREFAEMRVRLYEFLGDGFRAGRHHAPRYVRLREDVERTRRTLSEQFELQFRPERDALPASVRLARTLVADLMSQLDSIDLLRRHRRLTVDETVGVVEEALRAALTSG